MNEKPVTVWSTALRYGLIVGLISVIYSLILSLTDNSMNRALSSISYLFIIGGMVMAFKYFKEHNGGFMRYGQGLGIGTLMSLIAGFITSLFMYIYVKFIDTTLMDRAMEMQRAQMEEAGTMSDEEIEMAIEMGSKFSTPELAFVSAIIGLIIVGFLMSLVIAAAMRNPRPEFE